MVFGLGSEDTRSIGHWQSGHVRRQPARRMSGRWLPERPQLLHQTLVLPDQVFVLARYHYQANDIVAALRVFNICATSIFHCLYQLRLCRGFTGGEQVIHLYQAGDVRPRFP